MRVVLFLVGLLVCVRPVFAVPVPWLYDVDVAVDGRTADARMAVSGAALAVVLSRVSGLAHVPRNAAVRTALAGSESYYDRFVFLNDRELRIHFVPVAVLNLMDEAKLPVWSANRPPVMAWLVVESGGVRRIVDGGHALGATLVERARQRGLILKLPLMDLEDRLRVRPSVIWGRLFSPLSEASARYQADVILVGRLREQACIPEPLDDLGVDGASALCGPMGGSIYAGSVEAWMDGEEFTTDFTATDSQDAGRMIADFIADELASRFAVLARAPNRIALTIGGITTPIGYGRLLGYLDALEFVTAVDVAAVRDDRLEITLHTRAGFDQLVELFQKDGRILPDPADGAVLTWQGP